MPKISELQPAVSLDGTESVPIVKGGQTQRTSVGEIVAQAVAASGTVTSITMANATGITWSGSPITGAGTFTPTLDATLAALAGANWAANSLAVGSGADTVSQVTFAANQFPARSSTGNLVAKAITDFGLSILDDADATAVRTTIGAQALDATLTALAGANWAANSLAIGSGADTVAQVTFAANTFPGRSSSGNLVAKTITDTALSALAQPMRGTYTPVYNNLFNATATTAYPAQWVRIDNTIVVSAQVDIDPTAAGGCSVQMSLPVASNFANAYECSGTVNSGTEPGKVYAEVTNNLAVLEFTASNTANHTFTLIFMYQVIP